MSNLDIIENRGLWYAYDNKNKIITIDLINDENKNNKYTCPICGSEVIARTGKKKIHHFAHRDKSKCTNESMIHFWVKNELIKPGDIFHINYDRNATNNCTRYVCKEVYIEKEVKTKHGTYRPDITIVTESNEIVYFEICKSNKKNVDDFINIWLELNNTVVEVDVKDMVERNTKYKAIYSNGKCLKNFDRHNKKEQYINHVLENSNIKEAKERLSKLNWFWEDCKKYRMNKIDEYDFMTTIDFLEPEDRVYMVDGLLKTSCNNFRKLYLGYKQKQIEDFIISYLDENKINMIIRKDEETVRREIFNKNFIIPCVIVGNEYLKLYSDNFNEKDAKMYINNYKLIKNYDYIKLIKNNINNKFKDYYVDIHFRNKNSFELDLKYKYSYIYKDRIEICEDFNNIEELICDEINKIRKDIKYNLFENKINTYINNKINIINTKLNKINNKRLYVKYEYLSENVFNIIFKLGFRKINVCKIYGNTLYDYSKLKSIYFSNIEEFKNIFENTVSNKIREIRYKQ